MDDPTDKSPFPSKRKKQALKEFQEKTGVVLANAFENGTREDAAAIERQLGFIPTNVISVASRGETGEPTVLKLYPLAVSLKGARAGNGDRQPFPTMYWLSCPSLKAAVSQLENQGLVGEWERRLQADTIVLEQMKAAHKSYAEERWAMLTSADLDIVKQRGWQTSLGLDVGVAGISKSSTVKCLHTHLAHFLATGENVIGSWVHDALQGGLHISSVAK